MLNTVNNIWPALDWNMTIPILCIGITGFLLEISYIRKWLFWMLPPSVPDILLTLFGCCKIENTLKALTVDTLQSRSPCSRGSRYCTGTLYEVRRENQSTHLVYRWAAFGEGVRIWWSRLSGDWLWEWYVKFHDTGDAVSESNLTNLHTVIKNSETIEISTFTLFSRSFRLSQDIPRHVLVVNILI